MCSAAAPPTHRNPGRRRANRRTRSTRHPRLPPAQRRRRRRRSAGCSAAAGPRPGSCARRLPSAAQRHCRRYVALIADIGETSAPRVPLLTVGHRHRGGLSRRRRRRPAPGRVSWRSGSASRRAPSARSDLDQHLLTPGRAELDLDFTPCPGRGLLTEGGRSGRHHRRSRTAPDRRRRRPGARSGWSSPTPPAAVPDHLSGRRRLLTGPSGPWAGSTCSAVRYAPSRSAPSLPPGLTPADPPPQGHSELQQPPFGGVEVGALQPADILG